MNIGIIGAGLIGKKRAEAMQKTQRGKLVAVADVDIARARELAQKYGAEALGDWKKLVARKDIDAVLVAVPNVHVSKIVLAALKNKKHVLCEKPFGISAKESQAMLAAARRAKRVVKVGFNHRFHAAILKAHEIFEAGGIGKVLFIRGRYGHGGRLGMEKEWRFDKKISGGGELLDQGVHLIDLARWFAGDFEGAYGLAENLFWNTKLDDNAFALLRNKQATASIHVSTTNWKNIFSFEVFGELGYLQAEGKGGSYGPEVLTWGRRPAQFGVPEVQTFAFEPGDESWNREWDNFLDAVAGKKKVIGDALDGLRANQIVEAIYRSTKEHKEIKLR
ncbi:MAG TPA: Gfo/Idh/MocA family oxidoreductase [Candidatus Paceibacterota bacterium]|nr:Gfo/Idh/MocA family oxidoreductase [Candidatus Paceibacterota bacterium]